jgi:RNA:NAD 2'-phosphotransferase (TPT1/KptA family)
MSDSSYTSRIESTESINATKEEHIKSKIGKFVAYLLRYGAIKEQIQVQPGGFVKLDDLILHPYFKTDFYKRLLIEELKFSISHRNKNRFEIKKVDGVKYVRATYGRKLERSQYHDNTTVKRLLETCLDFVIKNIQDYNFEGFPDEFLIK